MAISTSPTTEQRRRDESTNVILDKLSRTNTFDSDWTTLRDHLHQSLISTLPLFLSRGPPRPYRPPISPIIGPTPINLDPTPSEPSDGEGEKPPSESLLLSPSQPLSSSTSTSTPESSTTIGGIPRSLEVEPSATPSTGRLDSLTTQDDLKPSTTGGLVIPPFPPLDRNKRLNSPSPSITSYSGNQIISSPRTLNGIRAGAQRIITIGPSVLDDEYDEETTIGGKILPGWMDNEESEKELNKVISILDDMDFPPFTIQRLAELLIEPTRYYSTFGKFIRAIEKTLLVTTPWEKPSYTPIPSTSFTVPTTRSTGGGSSSSSASSDNGYDSDSTMPPGSSTPMFSPIPFLAQQQDELSLHVNLGNMSGGEGDNSIMNGGSSHQNQQQRSLDDGLMSPLMLSEDSGVFGSNPNPRSPTPEPEENEVEAERQNDSLDNDDIDMSIEEEEEKPIAEEEDLPPRPDVAQGTYESIEHSDPAHQSYLGRVDELDTGPISNSPTTPKSQTNNGGGGISPLKSQSGHGHGGEEMNIPVPGTGEGGNMTPHGMSDKPVPISSTTVVKDESSSSSRTIASLPRSSSEKSLRDRFVSAGGEDEGENGEKDDKKIKDEEEKE